MIEITINKNDAGQRFDKYLFKYFNNAPKSFVYKMLRKKNILLNGKKCSGDEKLNIGDTVKLFISDETISKFKSTYSVKASVNSNIKPLNTKDIVYEDDDIILINKKAGFLSQKADNKDVSINEMLISYLLSEGKLTANELETFKPSVCNRLDRNTTGLITAGKSLLGLQELSLMFKDRYVDKYYITIVLGSISENNCVEGYLTKDKVSNKVYISKNETNDGEYVKTEYIPLTTFKYKEYKFTLLKVKLHTGKPHQIRAHLASLNNPIIGDAKYGHNGVNQLIKADFGIKYQLLHSFSLTFPLDGIRLENVKGKTFTAPIPTIYEKLAGGDIYGYLEFKRT